MIGVSQVSLPFDTHPLVGIKICEAFGCFLVFVIFKWCSVNCLGLRVNVGLVGVIPSNVKKHSS